MVVLAIYFCIADTVLIAQCLYYNQIYSRRYTPEDVSCLHIEDPSQPLLARKPSDLGLPGSRRRSSLSQRRCSSSIGTATLPTISEDEVSARPWIKNTLSVIVVCAIGAAGWAIAWQVGLWRPTDEGNGEDTNSNIGASILGYLSAVCYLG